MSTHNLCFEQKYISYLNFLSKKFPFLVVKFSIYLNRRVSVMNWLLDFMRIVSLICMKSESQFSEKNKKNYNQFVVC